MRLTFCWKDFAPVYLQIVVKQKKERTVCLCVSNQVTVNFPSKANLANEVKPRNLAPVISVGALGNLICLREIALYYLG